MARPKKTLLKQQPVDLITPRREFEALLPKLNELDKKIEQELRGMGD